VDGGVTVAGGTVVGGAVAGGVVGVVSVGPAGPDGPAGATGVPGVVGVEGLTAPGGRAVAGGTVCDVFALASFASFFCLSLVNAPIAKPAPTPTASTAATPAATQIRALGARR
jgi:hypothetical protein